MEALSHLGINWVSMLQYFVNTFLLLVILGWLTYKPILKVLDQRRTHIKNSIDEANTLKAEFERKYQEMKAEQLSMHAQFETQMSKLQTELTEKKTQLIADMDAKRRTLLEDTEAELQKRRSELLSQVESDVLKAMTFIVSQYIATHTDPASVEKSLEKEWSSFVSRSLQ